MSGLRPEIRERVALGSNAVFRTPDGEREFPDNQPSVGMFFTANNQLGIRALTDDQLRVPDERIS